MRTTTDPKRRVVNRRLLLLGGLLLGYPFLKFINHIVPGQPRLIPVDHKIPPSSGIFVAKDFFLFDRNGKCWALSRTCTHLGCRLNYFPEHDIIACPCHSSRFDVLTGKVLHGPARTPLPSFTVARRESSPYYMIHM